MNYSNYTAETITNSCFSLALILLFACMFSYKLKLITILLYINVTFSTSYPVIQDATISDSEWIFNGDCHSTSSNGATLKHGSSLTRTINIDNWISFQFQMNLYLTWLVQNYATAPCDGISDTTHCVSGAAGNIQYWYDNDTSTTLFSENSRTSGSLWDSGWIMLPTGKNKVTIQFVTNVWSGLQSSTCSGVMTVSNFILYGTTKAPTMAPTIAPSRFPTTAPSVAPTNNPTAAPTMSPTFTPSKAPINAPTTSPTSTPTFSPSAIPTFSPTKTPTISPTLTPTAAPTTVPSISPSDAPTLSPTIAPSDSPTKAPTISPTVTPTTSPSKFPSNSPTLMPTSMNDFDSNIHVIFSMDKLTVSNNKKLIWNTSLSIDIMHEIINSHLFISKYTEYHQYKVVMTKIDSIDVTDTQKLQRDVSIAQNEHTFSSIIYGDTVERLGSIIGILGTSYFQSGTQSDLRLFFQNEQLIFSVSSYSDPYENDTKEDENNWQYYIISSMVLLIAIMSVLTILHNHNKLCSPKTLNKLGLKRVDNGSYISFAIYITQIWDLYSDVALIVEMITMHNALNDGKLIYCVIAAFIFTVLPYISNMLSVYFIYNHRVIQNNHFSAAFFKANLKILVLLVCISGGTYSTLCLMSSRILGIKIFCSGLCGFEIEKLSSFKILSGVLLQNLPQIGIQVVYTSIIGRVTKGVIFAAVSSLISSLSSLVIFIIQKRSRNMKMVTYDLKIVTKSNNMLSDTEYALLSERNGLFQGIGRCLCEILDVPHSMMQISSVKMHKNGFVIKVHQQILKLQSNEKQLKSYIKSMYDQHLSDVNNGICQFFDLDNDRFSVLFVEQEDNFELFNLSTNYIALENECCCVEDFLSSLGMVQYLQLFVMNGFDTVDIIKRMSQNDLQDIGMESIHSNVLFNAINDGTIKQFEVCACD